MFERTMKRAPPIRAFALLTWAQGEHSLREVLEEHPLIADLQHMAPLEYRFDWDPTKALANVRKHGVRFEDSMRVFFDPLALTRHDTDNGCSEERWVTLGQTGAMLLVVIHTFIERDEHTVDLRIISARRPTADERRQYETGQYRIQEAVMKNEYDFSQAERGKFYREGAVAIIPFHLAADVVDGLSALATEKGIPASDLANEILRRAIAEMNAAGRPSA